MKKLWILIAGAIVFANSPSAGEGTGTDLYEACVRSGNRGGDVCDLYLKGISEGLFFGQSISKQGQATCLPEKEALDVRQTRLIVEKFMRDHPERLNQKAGVVVLEALILAFPCKSGSSGFTAKTLYEWCSSKSDQKIGGEYLMCVLYFRGFLNGVAAAHTLAENPQIGMSLCLPEVFGADEAAAAYIRGWRDSERKKGATNLTPLSEADPEVAVTSLLALKYLCKK